MRLDIRIRSRDLEGALKLYVERRLQFSLSRCASRLGRVRVHIAEVPGTQGSASKSCRVRAQLPGIDRVVQREVVHENLYIAIDLAIDRLSRSLDSILDDSMEGETVLGSDLSADRSRAQD